MRKTVLGSIRSGLNPRQQKNIFVCFDTVLILLYSVFFIAQVGCFALCLCFVNTSVAFIYTFAAHNSRICLLRKNK